MEQSFWYGTYPDPPHYPTLNEDITTDLLVIGGGFTGVATAYYLSERGIKTTLIEQKEIGWGASGRNGGMILAGYQQSIDQLIKRYGVEAAIELDRYSLNSMDEVSGLIQKYKIDCHLRELGCVTLANENQRHDLEIIAALTGQHLHREMQFLEGNDLAKEIKTGSYRYGLLDPLSRSFHPLKYVKGLAEVVANMGATIFEKTKALKVIKINGRFFVETNQGMIEAREVIYSTDGYSGKLVNEIDRAILPMPSLQIATEVLDQSLIDELMPTQRLMDDDTSARRYFSVTFDQRIIFGRIGYKYPATQWEFKRIEKNLFEIFPALQDCTIDYRWGGLVGATLDRFPVIGRTNQASLYSVGYAGQGTALTTMHGKMLAQIIAGEAPMNETFLTTPLKNIPFHQFKQFYIRGINVGLRLMDKFNISI